MLPPADRINIFLSELVQEFDLKDHKESAPVLNEALNRFHQIQDPEVIGVCVRDCLYHRLLKVLKIDTDILKGLKTRAERLAEYNVPHTQRKIILQLEMDAALCPLTGKWVDLYGPKRGTSKEIYAAAESYSPRIKALQFKRRWLNQLARLIELEEKKGSNR